MLRELAWCALGLPWDMPSNEDPDPASKHRHCCTRVCLSLTSCLQVGFNVNSPYRYALLMVLINMHSLVLCQYVGCCDHTGTVGEFVARVVSVALGCTLPTILSQLVLPW